MYLGDESQHLEALEEREDPDLITLLWRAATTFLIPTGRTALDAYRLRTSLSAHKFLKSAYERPRIQDKNAVPRANLAASLGEIFPSLAPASTRGHFAPEKVAEWDEVDCTLFAPLETTVGGSFLVLVYLDSIGFFIFPARVVPGGGLRTGGEGVDDAGEAWDNRYTATRSSPQLGGTRC